MNPYLRFAAAVCLLVGACSPAEKQPDTTFRTLVVPATGHSANLSDVCQDFTVVPLETNEESLIGNIGRVRTWEDRIYILAKSGADRLLIFDRASGHFISSHALKGGGPEESVSPIDFDIIDGRVYVLDSFGHKIVVYQSDMTFESAIALPYQYLQIEHAGDQFVLLKANANEDIADNHKIEVVDMAGNPVVGFYPQVSTDGNFKANMAFSTFNDTVLYSELFNDTIFAVNAGANEFGPRYYLDYGEDKLSDELLQLQAAERIARLNSGSISFAGFNQHILEFTDHLYFNFLHNEHRYTGQYEKSTGQLTLFSDLAVDGYPFRIEEIQYKVDDSTAVAVVTADKINQQAAEAQSESPVGMFDNPVLVFMTME